MSPPPGFARRAKLLRSAVSQQNPLSYILRSRSLKPALSGLRL